MEKDETKRILMDWWGACRTCKHWGGRRASQLGAIQRHLGGTCHSDKAPYYMEETQRGGTCSEWDSFDTDAALELLEEHEK